MEEKFYQACRENQVEKLRDLLLSSPSLNINWNRNGIDGFTPLHIASKSGHHEIVSLLLTLPGIEVNQRKSDGVTPFLLACYHGRLEVVKKLLQDDRVEINLGDKDNCTPIWNAACNGHYDVIKWMIASGRGLELEKKGKDVFGDKKEYSPGEIARKEKRNEIAELMERVRKEPVEVRRELRSELGIRGMQLESVLEISLSYFATCAPEEFDSVPEITALSVIDSGITELPREFSLLTNLVILDLSKNPLSPTSIAQIPKIIQNNPGLQSLNLLKISMSPEAYLAIFQSLVWNLKQGRLSLQQLQLEDVKLSSIDGLGVVPIEILRLGSKKIVQFFLDLFQSPEALPLYQARLTLLGNAGARKPEFFECLFPLQHLLIKRSGLLKQEVIVRLQGSTLTVFKGIGQGEIDREVRLDPQGWELVLVPKTSSVKLVPTKKSEKEIELSFPERLLFDAWVGRLKRVTAEAPASEPPMPEFQTAVADHPITREFFQDIPGGKLDLTIWDYPGRREFVTPRSVFVILWNMNEGEKGLHALQHWFSTLASKLHTGTGSMSDLAYSSVVVVGSFLERAAEKREEKNMRATQIDQLAANCGLKSALQYFEVCYSTLEGVDVVQDAIFKTVLSHAHMGEQVPRSYLQIREHLAKLQREYTAEVPLIDSSALVKRSGLKDSLVKRALRLLSLWGECVVFKSSTGHTVVYNPDSLLAELLRDLSGPELGAQAQAKTGVLKLADFHPVWARFQASDQNAEQLSVLTLTFLRFLEVMGVCFLTKEGKKVVIPSQLPEKPDEGSDPDFKRAWPEHPTSDRPAQIEHIFTLLAVVPEDLVRRLWIHLRDLIRDTSLVWRHDVVVSLREVEAAHAWIAVDPQVSVVAVRARGADASHATKLKDLLVTQISELMRDKYPSIRWSEKTTAAKVDKPMPQPLSLVTKDSQDYSATSSPAMSPKNGTPSIVDVKATEKGQISHPQLQAADSTSSPVASSASSLRSGKSGMRTPTISSQASSIESTEGIEEEIEDLLVENSRWREVNKEQRRALKEQEIYIEELRAILQDLVAKHEGLAFV